MEIFDRFYPSVYEVEMASNIFMNEINKYMKDMALPQDNVFYMSPETVLICAISAVWQEARKYQSGKR